jgi:hypothetical protein
LLLVFSILSIYFYGRLKEANIHEIVGMTQEQAASLPADRIVAKSPNADNSDLVDVTVAYTNAASDDFAKQVFATVSTLVVAVSGFYFGARTSSASRKTADPPTLKITGPNSPFTLGMDPATKRPLPLNISAETNPVGLSLEAKIDGSKSAFLKQISHNEFRYEPDQMPGAEISIAVSLSAYPDVRQSILVRPQA